MPSENSTKEAASLISESDITNLVKQYVAQHKNARRASEALGYNECYLDLVIRGFKPVTKQIALKLGYREVKFYQKIDCSQSENAGHNQEVANGQAQDNQDNLDTKIQDSKHNT